MRLSKISNLTDTEGRKTDDRQDVLWKYLRDVDKDIKNIILATNTDLDIRKITIGGSTNYLMVDSNGDLFLKGASTVFKDVYFPQGMPKTSGAGSPTLNTITGGLKGYSYSENDINQFDPQEYPHDGVSSGSLYWHIHWISMTDVAATRGINWEIEFTISNPNAAFPSTTTVSYDYTIAENTPTLTHFLTPITTTSMSGIGPGTFIIAKLKRIASAITAPAADPFVLGLHFHYELDQLGSRTEFTK